MGHLKSISSQFNFIQRKPEAARKRSPRKNGYAHERCCATGWFRPRKLHGDMGCSMLMQSTRLEILPIPLQTFPVWGTFTLVHSRLISLELFSSPAYHTVVLLYSNHTDRSSPYHHTLDLSYTVHFFTYVSLPDSPSPGWSVILSGIFRCLDLF